MSKKHRGEPHEEHTDESWLIPYADLLTLLLALFIVLYASSNVDMKKVEVFLNAWETMVAEGGSMTYIPYFAGPTDYTEEPTPDETDAGDEMREFEQMQITLQRYFIENQLDAQVTTSIDARGLVISMNDAILFDPGSAEIRPEFIDTLVRIGVTINRLDNYIRVEGHTDNVPMSTSIFPTNWELSGGRAANVVRLFVEMANIPPEKLMAAAYGEFRPIGDNSTAEGRGKNRRVDILLLSSKYNALEEQRPN